MNIAIGKILVYLNNLTKDIDGEKVRMQYVLIVFFRSMEAIVF